jgi:hypothetical protein
MLKGARVASSGFLISTLKTYKNCKETVWELQNNVRCSTAGLVIKLGKLIKPFVVG